MEGGELFAKISERTKPFTEQEVAKIMYQICSAVRHLHSMSIAHRGILKMKELHSQYSILLFITRFEARESTFDFERRRCDYQVDRFRFCQGS